MMSNCNITSFLFASHSDVHKMEKEMEVDELRARTRSISIKPIHDAPPKVSVFSLSISLIRLYLSNHNFSVRLHSCFMKSHQD